MRCVLKPCLAMSKARVCHLQHAVALRRPHYAVFLAVDIRERLPRHWTFSVGVSSAIQYHNIIIRDNIA